MRTDLKFHVIALGAISGIILLAYALMGTPTADAGTSPYTIHITSATWGMSCNPSIAQASQAPRTDGSGKLLAAEPVTTVTHDNVLTTVQSLCNGQPNCNVRVTSETLGSEPMKSCYKHLQISYRCFSTDKLNTLEIGQGQSLHIDCSSTNAHDAAQNPAVR